MKKLNLAIVLLIVLLSITGCANTSNTVAQTPANETATVTTAVDTSENSIATKEKIKIGDVVDAIVSKGSKVISDRDEKVQSIRNGTIGEYTMVTVGEAFDNFFADETWHSFDATTGEKVVEFSGKCMYADTKVTAKIQFILSNDNSFEIGAITFNDVPQNGLIKLGLLSAIYEEYGGNKSEAENDSFTVESADNKPAETSSEKKEEVSSSTPAKPKKEISAIELYGVSYKELKVHFQGAKNSSETVEGFGTMVNFEGYPFSFVLDAAEKNDINDNSKVTAVYILEGGKVTDKLTVGMTFKEIAKKLNQELTPEQSMEDDSWNISVYISNAHYVIFESPTSDGKTTLAILKAD